jgi:hypothetical protein
LATTATHSGSSNGRTLTDDAADAFLAVLTNGKVTGDKVGPHIDLLAEFPYLGPPHNISVPSHAASPIDHLSLEGGRGVEGPDEVIKYLLAGADAVQAASSLLRHGPSRWWRVWRNGSRRTAPIRQYVRSLLLEYLVRNLGATA